MRFNKLDLNQLVVLDAILSTRSVGRAAERLFLSQPATSCSQRDRQRLLKGNAGPRHEGPDSFTLSKVQNEDARLGHLFDGVAKPFAP